MATCVPVVSLLLPASPGVLPDLAQFQGACSPAMALRSISDGRLDDHSAMWHQRCRTSSVDSLVFCQFLPTAMASITWFSGKTYETILVKHARFLYTTLCQPNSWNQC